MHAVTLFYSGPGAKELFDLLATNKDSVETTIRGVAGFVAHTLVRTPEGGMSVTVCQDKTGTDESLERARDWIKENAPDLQVNPPGVAEGEIILQLS